MLLLVLRHIQSNQCILITEEELCQSLRKLGLTNTGRTSKNERAARTVRILQPGTGTADRAGQRLNSVLLPDHTLVQLVLHLEQTRGLFFGNLVHRNAG